ncbi:MAG: hydrogenase iron-sulfur subunit [Xanthomonadales bacterium]|nr:hydrogenase iron-sulfur subunit [Xanthomonadales bacterium]
MVEPAQGAARSGAAGVSTHLPPSRVQAAWAWCEDRLDLASPRLNPLRHLGSIALLMFWVLVASGVYLYAMIDTSVDDAHASIDRLSREQWYFGGLLRSMHRYAADVLVLTTTLHLLREWSFGRFRRFRAASWWTGVALLPLITVSAIGGFWLNWDQLGQYSAIATAEWLDWWPLFASPFTRNFLGVASISDRLFSLFVFVHIGVPLLMVFGIWFHVRRLAHAAVWPPRPMLWTMLLLLLGLAVVAPVLSHAPADLARVPEVLAYDWILLFVHPLVTATSSTTVWLAALGLLALLLLLPFWRATPVAAPAVAEVDPAHCSGCRRCVADCPYDAIRMLPHPTRRGFALAEVDADACASCGICVGSCPSSTPFRSMQHLRTGIDMPQQPIDALRRALRERLGQASAKGALVVFGCDHGASVRKLEHDDVAAFSLICTGMLPPSFIEYALRDGAAGVVVVTCRDGGCAFRLGQRWTAERLAREREPALRATVPTEKFACVAAGPGDILAVSEALARLRAQTTGEARSQVAVEFPAR